MELTKDESKRILRRIELEAYSALVTALRAQGELDREKKRLLRELGEQLSISTERHRAEIRRAISDDRLSMIAECVCGSDASVEWESEGRRVVPLMPRLVPQTAFTGTATAAANHAASVNSTISSSLKGRTKDGDEEEDAKTRKRQRTTSPKPVQKVIVSSIHKTTAQRDTVATVTSAADSANVTAKETAKFVRTCTFPTKQENSSSPLSSVSMKINSSHSGSGGHQITSKPIILGGSKSTSSVSVASAANKHVAPLPESCLQAHASVVSGNKNRAKLNLVKQKPKPKFKPLVATVKIKTLSPVRQNHGQNAIALQLPSTDKTKANEVSTSISKTIQAPRNTASITVPPRSSISLTTFKNSLQQKPKSQSPLGIVRNIEATSRHASGQFTKGSPVSRLSRPLPAILPKSIPPKSISTVSSPGRKLASILPAPAKSTTSTLPNPVKLPVVASSSTTSPPIPIAPSPRPPQSFHGLSSTVLSKVSSVSLTSKASSVLKSDIRETCTAPYTSESAVNSAVLPETATVGSKKSSPSLSSKSKESIHERETLSPVSDILTLVTSPSSVPYVSSSPVKSKPLTIRSAVNEISLKCDEKLSEVKDFLKEEEVELEGFRSLFDAFPSKLPQEVGGSQISKMSLRNDSLQTLSKPGHNILQLSQGIPVKAVPTELCLQKPEKQDTKVTQEISDVVNKTKDVASSGLDLSPLVDELLSNNSLLTQEKHLEDTSAVPNPPFSICTTPSISCEVINKDVEHWIGFESALLDAQESERINVENKSCLNLEIIEEISDIAYKDNNDISVKKDMNQLALTTKNIEEQSKIDHIQSQEEIELNDDDPKVMIQMEETVDLKSKEVMRELHVAEKENSMQVDKLSHLKKQEEPMEMVINATEHAEKSDETCVVSEKENENSIIKGDLKSLEKTNSLIDNINSDISVITATEKVVGRDGTRLLKTEKLDENLQLKKMESAQLSVSATKPVEKLSDSSTWEQKTESEFLDDKTTETVEQAAENSLTIDEKDNDPFFVGPIQNQRLLDGESKATKSEVPLSVPDPSLSRSLCSGIPNITESLTTEHQVENLSKDYETGSRQESGEEQHSGSDTGSTEGAFIRTSGRKRKAPPPRDLSLAAHPPGWIRGALLLLQRVSRFRGNARLKGEPSAASWFLKPVETADAPGYHKIVKVPMDFGTIKSKLETAKYSDHTQFHSDMLLVKTNCYKYNPPGHDVRRDCDEVFQFYEVEYEKFSEKLEKCHLFSPKKARPLFGGNESK